MKGLADPFPTGKFPFYNINMRAFLFLFLLPFSSLFGQPAYDLLLKGGKIIDGTGNPWYYGDVGIKDGKILAIGNLDEKESMKTIFLSGKMVVPGFVDVHTHIEGRSLNIPTADNFILDGVTTAITGNCGSSFVKIGEYFWKLDSIRTSINIASLIGHNSVRAEAMGTSNRDPSPEELKRMEDLVESAMLEGAIGFSTGLIYVPGTYSKTPEVVRLARASSRYGGVYASHIRNEGDHVLEAIDEAINIGKEAQMPVEISHFKVTYKPNWGRSVETLRKIEDARNSGIDVTVDQYPYVASSTSLNTLAPSWIFSGGKDSLMARLKDRSLRKKIKEEMVINLKKKELKDFSYALVAGYSADSLLNGKNISAVNRLKGRKHKAFEEAETILEMIEMGGAQMVYFSMNEEDLRRIMQYPFTMIASDAGIQRFGAGVPHPRAYGTNARVLGVYVREARLLKLEEAIRRMTSLPAQRFNIRDRGLIREGYFADLVIFDEKVIGDQATFEKPHAYAKGFSYVFVNGKMVVENGIHQGVRAGVVIRGPGFGKAEP